jgi:transcription initiation factor TFIID TATA-box-binding protein
MISVGSKRFEDAKRDLKHAVKKLEELELIKPVKITVKLQNIVATGELCQSVDIETLVRRLPNTIYEPEQFPGAIYYAGELEGASVLIFASGKVVFAGLRSIEMLKRAEQVLEELARLIDTS